MKKVQCSICSNAKGKRVCKINNNLLICPICCAKTRNNSCEGCNYYVQAEKFSKEKAEQQKSNNYMMSGNPEVDMILDQALEMIETGKLNSAEKIISKLLTKYPHFHTVQYAMGVLYAFKGQHDEAISYFDRAIAIYPNFVEAWFNKGTAHQKKLDIEGIIKSYQKVVQLGNPSDDFVIHADNFLRNFEKQVRKESGLTLDGYLRSMKIFTEAHAAMENMQWEKALSGFEEVIAMNPSHTQSYGNMGICYGYLGQKQEALAAFDRALELDPNYEPAILNRAIIDSVDDDKKLSLIQYKSVDYYKDYPFQKESLIEDLYK